MKMISATSCALVALIGLQDCFATKPGAFFNVTTNSNTITIKTTIPHHTYKFAGIKLNTANYSLAGAGTECSPDKDYCLFSVSDTQSKTITLSGTGQGQPLNITLCLNGKGPLSCQNFDNLNVLGIPAYAYISGYGTPSISVAYLDPVTGLVTTYQDAGGGSVLAGVESQGVAINALGTIAYIISGYDSTPPTNVYQCSINPSDKTFTSCSAIPIVLPLGYQAEYGSITLNTANTLAYIVDSYDGTNGRVIACPIIAGNISGICTDTGATNISSYGVKITLNYANDTAYIADYDTPSPAAVTVCSVNGAVFSNCVRKTGFDSTTFSSPAGVALNTTEDILYVTDYGANVVYGCSTAANPGPSFSSCFVATSVQTPWSITLNPANTFAYIGNFAFGTLFICPVLPDGTFGACNPNLNFPDPTGVALGF